MIKIKPEIWELFPFSKEIPVDRLKRASMDEILKNESFKKHLQLVMKTLSWAIENLGNHEEFQVKLQDLGKRHVKYGMTPDYIQVFG